VDIPDKPGSRSDQDEVSGTSPQAVLRSRETAVAAREAADRSREDAATLREEAVRAREEAAQARSELEALAGQIREANEHLVVANLRSQALAEEAHRANRVKDEFIAMVSHELRTPLNAVVGWARLLASMQLSEGHARHAAETIERSAASLTLIIDDLLDVSRMAAGKLKLRLEPIDLVIVAREACDAVGPAAAGRRLDLTFSADDPSAGIVNGDSARLRQAIENLLTNAIKFTPEGGRVSVSVERAGSQMEVAVVDTGRGISADFMPHLFERFRQGDGAASWPHTGLGLGLPITRQIVELHGGAVHAASQGEGCGATFTIRLPVAAPAAEAERPPGREAPEAARLKRRPGGRDDSPPPSGERLDGVHILLVDDHADGLALASLILTELGASVQAVRSAREARQALGGQRPDVVVSDIGMVGEDGYALIRHIREHDMRQGGFLPAVALTGYAGAEDRRRILAAGFQAYVLKPVERAELTATIAALARGVSRASRVD